MSTRALIAKVDHNGQTTVIYSHSDGYPEYVGKVLANYYTDPDKVDALMALGDVSILGISPVDEPKMWDLNYEAPETPEGYYIRCRTYKGRGEDSPAAVFPSYKSAVENAGTQAYNYVYKNGVWYYGGGCWPDFSKNPRRVSK